MTEQSDKPEKLLPLESERLTYGYFMVEDLDFVHQFHNTPGVVNDPNLLPLPIPIENSQDWLAKQLKSYADEGMGHLKIFLKQSGKFIGRNGLRIIEIVEGVDGAYDHWYWYRGSAPENKTVRRELELGYAFLPEYWNKGYATESSMTLCELAFEKNLADKVVAAASADNPASCRVLEKIGFKEGEVIFGLDLELLSFELTR
ncbi:MAG: hypothetical protein CMQ38_10480 [Gammaproteobacteria bacterium]|nr:hypothetical protein [Gammaproteobacteria bacterium]|tara:strand:- start:206554 stop:207159 length:606 start_codon:yes stop_codon:yes gene_type:complete